MKKFLTGGLLSLFVTTAYAVSAEITIDFETDDFGRPLINGQSISTLPDMLSGETVFEFGNTVRISTRQSGTDGHLGAAIFDSSPGVNRQDKDLWVDKGNILILQDDNSQSRKLDSTYGWVFRKPNDEADFNDRGSIVFDFVLPSELVSIDLVDINGGAHVTLTLFDADGDQRIYDVPSKWTTDPVVAPVGWKTLYLNTLLPQPSEPNAIGGDATVLLDDAGFNASAVVRLDVAFDGNPSSAGLDQLVFFQSAVPLPEPSSALFGVIGLGLLLGRRFRGVR